jgi:hypothetical protein
MQEHARVPVRPREFLALLVIRWELVDQAFVGVNSLSVRERQAKDEIGAA